MWTNWIPLTNCTPSCGIAYQQVVRACLDSISGQSCSSSDCGGGNAIENELCVASPPCESKPQLKPINHNCCLSFYQIYLVITATPITSIRDPNLATFSYTLPNTMEFFGQPVNRLWVRRILIYDQTLIDDFLDRK